MMQTMRKITLLSLSLMLTSALAISTVLSAMLGYFDKYPTEQVEMLITVPSFAITAMIILNTWLSKILKGIGKINAATEMPFLFYMGMVVAIGIIVLFNTFVKKADCKSLNIKTEE